MNMPNICPKIQVIRRAADAPDSDRLPINPSNIIIANIENIIANTPDAVSIRPLAFHALNKVYCGIYKDSLATKKYCTDVTPSQYIHLHISRGGLVNREEYLLAFLPHSKTETALTLVTDELKSTIHWLSLSKQIFFVIFRYGKPVQSSYNLKHWQNELQKAIQKSGIPVTCVPKIKFIREGNKKIWLLVIIDSTRSIYHNRIGRGYFMLNNPNPQRLELTWISKDSRLAPNLASCWNGKGLDR
jgi:hypothetical protein